MASFFIRPARRADATTIALFNIQMAWETEQLRLDPTTVEQGVLAVFEEGGRGTYYVAEAEGGVAGCLLVTHEWSDWRNGDMWWVQSVYVHPGRRRLGVFRALLEHVRQAAAAQGVRAIRLYVEQENHRAMQTYASLGFAKTHYAMMQADLPG